MNAPTAILTIKWLARDTLGQAMASGVFWLMLTISAVCIRTMLEHPARGRVNDSPWGPHGGAARRRPESGRGRAEWRGRDQRGDRRSLWGLSGQDGPGPR